MILYYIKAMWLTFLAYGNYESRVKARTRYMQEALGGPEQYAAAFQEKLKESLNSDKNLKIQPFIQKIIKKEMEPAFRIPGFYSKNRMDFIRYAGILSAVFQKQIFSVL